MAKKSLWEKIKGLFSNHSATAESQVKDGILYAPQADGTYLLSIDKSVFEQLGQITFADFPTDQSNIDVDDDILDIEGDKSVETLKSPIAGKVLKRNFEIGQDIDQLDQADPQKNWIMTVQPAN